MIDTLMHELQQVPAAPREMQQDSVDIPETQKKELIFSPDQALVIIIQKGVAFMESIQTLTTQTPEEMDSVMSRLAEICQELRIVGKIWRNNPVQWSELPEEGSSDHIKKEYQETLERLPQIWEKYFGKDSPITQAEITNIPDDFPGFSSLLTYYRHEVLNMAQLIDGAIFYFRDPESSPETKEWAISTIEKKIKQIILFSPLFDWKNGVMLTYDLPIFDALPVIRGSVEDYEKEEQLKDHQVKEKRKKQDALPHLRFQFNPHRFKNDEEYKEYAQLESGYNASLIVWTLSNIKTNAERAYRVKARREGIDPAEYTGDLYIEYSLKEIDGKKYLCLMAEDQATGFPQGKTRAEQVAKKIFGVEPSAFDGKLIIPHQVHLDESEWDEGTFGTGNGLFPLKEQIEKAGGKMTVGSILDKKTRQITGARLEVYVPLSEKAQTPVVGQGQETTYKIT